MVGVICALTFSLSLSVCVCVCLFVCPCMWWCGDNCIFLSVVANHKVRLCSVLFCASAFVGGVLYFLCPCVGVCWCIC